MQDLLIFPFNGNGLEALSCLSEDYRFIGFIDDTPEKQGRHKLGFEVFSRKALQYYPAAKILAVPGSPSSFTMRHKIIADLNIEPERFATVIHPSASISPYAMIGKNCLIMANVVLTSNCVIGDHVCILPNTVVHHDSSLGHHTLIGSNVTLAGFTSVGANCYIGSGSSIINGIEIGDGSLIGMGSNVIRSVEPGARIVGNPGRNI